MTRAADLANFAQNINGNNLSMDIVTATNQISVTNQVSVGNIVLGVVEIDIMAMWRTADIQGYRTLYSDGGGVTYSWDNGTVRVDTSIGSHNWDLGKVRLSAGSYRIIQEYRPSPTVHGWNVYGTDSNGHIIRLQADSGWGPGVTTYTSIRAQLNKDLGYSRTFISPIYTVASETTFRIGMQTDPYTTGGYKYFVESAYLVRVR